MAKYNPYLAKVNRNYTFEELACVYGVHKNTIAQWVKNGLHCLKEKKPFLIMGTDVRLFLIEKRTARKRKCGANELYCVKCRSPSLPANNFVEYVPINATQGRLTAICCQCESIMNKFGQANQMGEYQAIYDLTVSKELENITDSK